MVGLVAVNGVGRQRTFTPRVGTANAVDAEVDIQIDKATTAYFVGMTDIFQVFFAVLPCTDAEGLTAIDAELSENS